MVSELTVKVPDVGVDGTVEVIEVCVAEGDQLEAESTIVVLESDKATVEVPCPETGEVKALLVKVGDKVSEGDDLISLQSASPSVEMGNNLSPSEDNSSEIEEAPAADHEQADAKLDEADSAMEQLIRVPDLGGVAEVEVIEVSVSEGDQIESDDTLLVLESDKASMDIPSPFKGEILKLNVQVGDKVSEGDVIATIAAQGDRTAPSTSESASEANSKSSKEMPPSSPAKKEPSVATPTQMEALNTEKVHAGPAVRKLARELGADLSKTVASGPRGRVLKEDLYAYIKAQVAKSQSSGSSIGGGALPSLPDFSKFGAIETAQMSKIHKVTAQNMQLSWATIPHVTQFDEADITDLESFRKDHKQEAEKRGVKLTPMAFLLKAVAYVLKALPQFNVSLDLPNNQVIQKKYIHIGMAVDTPSGLVVPVIRDVDAKSIWELAEECQSLASRAKDRQLTPAEMQGGCFTISSLGGIGGTAFTPIVNSPEVAILGVSKSSYKPVYDGVAFEPRLMLPLSLSYDHRAVNGADAARFTALMGRLLGDIRELLL